MKSLTNRLASVHFHVCWRAGAVSFSQRHPHIDRSHGTMLHHGTREVILLLVSSLVSWQFLGIRIVETGGGKGHVLMGSLHSLVSEVVHVGS